MNYVIKDYGIHLLCQQTPTGLGFQQLNKFKAETEGK